MNDNLVDASFLRKSNSFIPAHTPTAQQVNLSRSKSCDNLINSTIQLAFENHATIPSPPPTPPRHFASSLPQFNSLERFRDGVNVEDLEFEVSNASQRYNEWVERAHKMNAKIDVQIQKMDGVVQDQPSADLTPLAREVKLRYELFMRNLYCGQIIRRVAKTQISFSVAEGKKRPELSHLINLINGSENYLVRHLPPKLSPKQIVKIKEVLDRYDFFNAELERITSQITSKARIQ